MSGYRPRGFGWTRLRPDQIELLAQAHEAAKKAAEARNHAAGLMRRASRNGCTLNHIAEVTGLSPMAVNKLIRDQPMWFARHPKEIIRLVEPED